MGGTLSKAKGHAFGHAPFTSFRVTHGRGHAFGHAPFAQE